MHEVDAYCICLAAIGADRRNVQISIMYLRLSSSGDRIEASSTISAKERIILMARRLRQTGSRDSSRKAMPCLIGILNRLN